MDQASLAPHAQKLAVQCQGGAGASICSDADWGAVGPGKGLTLCISNTFPGDMVLLVLEHPQHGEPGVRDGSPVAHGTLPIRSLCCG